MWLLNTIRKIDQEIIDFNFLPGMTRSKSRLRVFIHNLCHVYASNMFKKSQKCKKT